MRRVKIYLRDKLIACQTCYQCYVRLKYRLLSLTLLTFCFYDLRNVMRYMYWGDTAKMHEWQLQAKLLFYYHKIEKGLSMPGGKRLFAIDVIPKVIRKLEIWESNGYSRNDSIYLGAISSLRSYRDSILLNNLDPESKIINNVEYFLARRNLTIKEQPTPIAISDDQIDKVITYEEFRNICKIRRSFRNFLDQPVTDIVVRQAVELAQLSPSACNRQPCKVYVVRDDELKRKVLSHQNGNAGFGHLAPVVMAITADMNHFFDASERHQPFIDGGLFSMSLLYAMQVQGLVSCCLNWCVSPKTDKAVHKLLLIPDSERIVMFVVAGYPPQRTVVPQSHRKSVDDILVFK